MFERLIYSSFIDGNINDLLVKKKIEKKNYNAEDYFDSALGYHLKFKRIIRFTKTF